MPYKGLLRTKPLKGSERSADRISFSGYPLRGFIYALGFLLPVNGSINSFMLIQSDILSG